MLCMQQQEQHLGMANVLQPGWQARCDAQNASWKISCGNFGQRSGDQGPQQAAGAHRKWHQDFRKSWQSSAADVSPEPENSSKGL
jgi:hypothetical protein